MGQGNGRGPIPNAGQRRLLTHIRGAGKDFGAWAWINAPLLIGEVTVNAGDLIFGDGDGVVCVPRARAAEVIKASEERDTHELAICRRLEADEMTLAIHRWN